MQATQESLLLWHVSFCYRHLLQLPSWTQADRIDENSLTMLHAEARQVIGMEKWESLCTKPGHCRPDYSLVIPILSVKKHKYIVRFVSLSRWRSEMPMRRDDKLYPTLWDNFWAAQHRRATTHRWKDSKAVLQEVWLESQHKSLVYRGVSIALWMQAWGKHVS